VRASRRGAALLALGAAAGLALAGLGLLERRRADGLPPDAAARVNGRVIARAEYERLLAALASDRRDGVGATERRHVLDRLIDEELLLERALALGLAREDPSVRKGLVRAVIDAVVSDAETHEPSARALAAFFEAHRDFFTRPGRLRVRQVWCRAAAGDGSASLARAHEAARRLRAGEEFAAVRAALGDPEALPLPDALLPPAKLLDYLGPTALRAALALEVGGVSDPVRAGEGHHVLALVERREDATPPLAEIRDEVRAEFRRRAGERALRRYLDDLRGGAAVEVAAGLP
jgi:hypothetical protein